MSSPNDPKINPRFAAFFAKKSQTTETSTLLKRNDTSGMCLVGVLDNCRRMPAKRSPGSFCVTMISDRCKIFDSSMFEKSGDNIILNKDENNLENRTLKNFENILLGTFECTDQIERSIGSIVKCHGFQRNKAGFLTCKSIQIIEADKSDSIIGLPVNIPDIDFETSKEKYSSAILQFRSADQDHIDWKNLKGNACSLNQNDDTSYASEEGELLFKGSCEAMSFDEPHQKSYLIELYWTATICRQFGVTNKDTWPKLAPTLLSNFRGFVKANIDIVASSGLSINDPDSSSGDYAGGYKVYSNHVEVDMKTTVQQAGEKLSKEQVLEYFEEEYDLEFEGASDNPLNSKTSLVKNLNETNGNLKKYLAAEGSSFYKISSGDSSNVFCILTQPLSKKRSK